ncbi:ketoacyl-synthetase C-terminal extension domain-containing protein, partial [Saccharothrix sp. ST-888]|uniref:ketoacyl-synthetase C-terminal extension domain-containing protein n=1 Tax=Saccharothrix sp. ST-888 TaxID=1427391 RepID=UPI002F41E504
MDWSAGAVELLSQARPWPETGELRRAGVSSFGFSGTNAHVIIEQAPEPVAAEEAPTADVPVPVAGVPVVGASVVPWVVSGRGAEALRGQAARLRAFAAGEPGLDVSGVGRSLATGRAVLENRA